ncbi:hypothetical protein ARMA_0300 [Ardenticatena maritima]|uniref:Uncharacterized protein n=1 Tax=Ardenticatena maritima TaxID=872965 RepID=A0A0N0RFA0_9CHLR|nr:hypothetical protein [Ardenticatena maritima]GAP61877.1 hypothetical protein ARMA_0300 [Ardenticatena maritima]
MAKKNKSRKKKSSTVTYSTRRAAQMNRNTKIFYALSLLIVISMVLSLVAGFLSGGF